MTPKNKKLRIVFFAAICFVVLLSIFSYSKINSLIKSAALVNHTSQVTVELEKVIGTLKDAETGHRGYLLTHDKIFLEPFTKGLNEYPQNIKNVKQLTSDNPEQQKSIAVIEQLAHHGEDYMRRTLELDKLQTPAVAELLIGKSIMDSLRLEINNMIARETTLMKKRNDELTDQTTLTPVLLLVLSLSALLILIIANWQLNKSLLTTQQLQIQIINKNAQLAKNKELEESKRLYETITQNTPDLIYVFDLNYRFSYANEALLTMWGLSWDAAIGKSMPEIGYEPWHAEMHKAEIDKIIATKKPVRGEVSFPHATLGNRIYDYIFSPVIDGDGKVEAIAGTSRDITQQVVARKQIEESEERFRSLAETLPQLVWVTDAKGNAEFASFRWKEYSGIDPKGEKEWKAIVHPDDYDNMSTAWSHSLATGDLYIFDVRLKNKEDEYRWHTVKGEPVYDKENKIVKWVGAFTDIQEQKIKEEKKDEFISIASHEMKTPLTTAKGYLQVLELALDESNHEAYIYAKKASKAISRLNELTSELLDVSKIRLGKLDYTITTFDFNTMIDNTVENIQLISKTHSIIKTGKVQSEVTGDKERLQQVVINLLTNAVKYSPQAKEVFINLMQEKDTVTVSIKDTGIGIAKENLTKIFDKFHRIEENALHFHGLGIGLFISQEIIQRHYGKLWAESEFGKGSTFYFTIPLSTSA